MEALTLYLLKVNGVFTLLFLFYLLLLRRDTFYAAKRLYLLGIAICSVGFPLLHLAALIPQKESIQYVIILINNSLPVAQTSAQMHFSIMMIIGYLLLSGIAATCVSLIVKYVQLFRVIRRCSVAEINGKTVYVPQKEINPFSFRGKVYLNPALYSADELSKIMEHEHVHIEQKHELDLLLISIFQSFTWMNPLYYWFSASVRENVEFLADKKVLKTGNDPKAYQYALLKVAQTTSMPLTQHFSISHLKKRIIMMNKKKTHALWSGKYLLVFPLLLATILLVNAGELKSAWTNADLSGESSNLTATAAPSDSVKQIKKQVIVIHTDKDSIKGEPLIFIDGKKISKAEMNDINPNTIKSINVWKDSMAVVKYGSEGKNGVILITMKSDGEKNTVEVRNNGNTKPSSSVAEAKTNLQNAIIIIDGVYSSREVMGKISPSDIQSVSVLKEKNATDMYGDKGKDGVIVIATKKYLSSAKDSPVKDDVMNYIQKQSTKKIKSIKIEEKDNKVITKGISDKNAAIFIDGQLADVKALQRLDYSKIRVINTYPISNFPELAIKYNLRKERIVQVFTK